MSCYQCHGCHLTALALYARREGIYRHYMTDPEKAERAAFVLLAEANYRSVRARYPNEPDPGVETEFCAHGAKQHPEGLEIVKAAHCFEHQANEWPGWEGSQAHELIDAIVYHATREIPGYGAEEWGYRCHHSEAPPRPAKPPPTPPRMPGLEHWLAVEVYRSEHDASNGGITSRARTLYVPHAQGPTRNPQWELQLVPGERGGTANFVPRALVGTARHTMWGGNFVHCSDARWGEWYGRQPIAVHDRVEGAR